MCGIYNSLMRNDQEGGSSLSLAFLPAHSQPWILVVYNQDSESLLFLGDYVILFCTDKFVNLQKHLEKWEEVISLTFSTDSFSGGSLILSL